MATLASLKKHRGGLKRHITCVYNRYKALPDAEVTVWLLEGYLSDIRENLDRIKELNSDILEKLEDPKYMGRRLTL